MKKWTAWVALVVVFALLTACGDAGSYIKQTYPLVSADGNGGNLSKVYAAEGKSVPDVADELAQKETPKETSKESLDQMFLLYSDKVIQIQKDPKDNGNTLVEVDSVQYAKEHYDSSFLQGYLAASLLQSVLGGSNIGSSSAGSSSTSRKNDGSTVNRVTKPSSSKPATSSRSGSFTRRK